MSELRRWSEEGAPPQIQRLLDVGQWERPSRAVFEQALRQVQAAGTAGALGGPLPGARTNAVRSAAKWTLIGTLIIGALAALTQTTTWKAPGDLPGPTEHLAASPPPVEPPAPPPPAVESPRVPPAAPQLAPSARAKAPPPGTAAIANKAPSERSAHTASQSSATASVCKPAVVEQIQMLEQVKGKIRAGRAAEALALLDRYDSYGKGRCFVPESLKHRMDAQAKLGDQAAARRTATAIKKRYPDTAQARTAEALLTK